MDGPDWLRTQLTSFTCPACGRRYRGSKIRLLAERDGLFFVDLDCARCGSHTVAIVTVEMDDTQGSITEISDLSLSTEGLLADYMPEHLGEELPPGAAPVTADDVLEMHEFLSAFKGDISHLFPRGGPGTKDAQRTDGAERR
jgi:transcription elongation factor Elf1